MKPKLEEVRARIFVAGLQKAARLANPEELLALLQSPDPAAHAQLVDRLVGAHGALRTAAGNNGLWPEIAHELIERLKRSDTVWITLDDLARVNLQPEPLPLDHEFEAGPAVVSRAEVVELERQVAIMLPGLEVANG